jgi:carbon storage regulator
MAWLSVVRRLPAADFKEYGMLVFERKLGETVVIDGGRIRLVVIETKSNHVRLGFEAPRDVSVHRGEVQERIDRDAED